MISIKRMKLTGAATLVSRGMKVLQAAPAAYPFRSPSMHTFNRVRSHGHGTELLHS
jgi:hypothetical protein